MIRSTIFSKFPQIISAISNKKSPDLEIFFSQLGTSLSQRARSKQIHGDIIHEVSKPGQQIDGDGLWTKGKNIFLEVRVADCVPILFYAQNNKQNIVAVVHAGRQGAHKNITGKMVQLLQKQGTSRIFVRIGPSISQQYYEFGKEVFDFFEQKYILEQEGKYFLNIKQCIIDQLYTNGISGKNIEISELCSFETSECYSRRGTQCTERMHAVIALK